VPTDEKHIIKLQVPKSGQKKIELPICVGNENKLLGVIEMTSSSAMGFNYEEDVNISASITHEKLLEIEVEVSGKKILSKLLNPLANKPLNEFEKKLLLAKQQLNMAILEYGSKLPVNIVINYAHAAKQAGDYVTAAEMYQAAERLDSNRNYSTLICYCYSMGGKEVLSDYWAEIAYNREPNEVSAYNLSLKKSGAEQIALLRESLSYNHKYIPSMHELGLILSKKDNPEGKILLKEIINIVKSRSQPDNIDLKFMKKSSELIGDSDSKKWANEKIKSINDDNEKQFKVYNDNNLVKSTSKFEIILGD
jgi:tetratricopeptide (TPR) repeat protein